jgi:dUTP pyrophosphatase
MTKLKIKPLRNFHSLPRRATELAAGWDIVCPNDVIIMMGDQRTIGCGFSVDIPSGYYLSIYPRSSIGKMGLIMPNSVGIIDEDYTGEIKVVLKNVCHSDKEILAGDRIAQMILKKYEPMELEVVSEIKETARGDGGFGSTGV